MTNSQSINRIQWMDNLRTITIYLVLLYHVGGVYESTGLWGWFWIVDDPDTVLWVGVVGIVFDVMVMPTIFFISGYLAPASLRNNSGWAFVKGKFWRLIVPWLIAMITLIPLYKVIFLFSRGLSQENISTYFHITNPNSQNWLWFLPVLFYFNVLYSLLSKIRIRIPRLSLKIAVLATMIIGFVCSVSIGGLVGFRSWTLTPVVDFENERLLTYFMAFLLGAFCFERGVFDGKPKGKILYSVINAIAWIPVTVHIFARLIPFVIPSGTLFSEFIDRLIWWLSFYLSLVSILYLMIESFRRYVDKTGRLRRELNRNSYGVYIIHVIVIGVFGTLLLKINLPGEAKYPILAVLTLAVSNLLVSVYRSGAKTILPHRRSK